MKEYISSLSKEGRVLIPASIREQVGFNAGELLSLSVVNGEVRVVSRRAAIRAMQARLARLRDPKNPAVDSLLRERRHAAKDE